MTTRLLVSQPRVQKNRQHLQQRSVIECLRPHSQQTRRQQSYSSRLAATHFTMHPTRSSSTASARSISSSCSSSPSQPIQIGFTPSLRSDAASYDASSYSSHASTSSTSSVSSTSSSTTPSPYGSSCLQRNVPSSYFSDAELFGDEQGLPYLQQAPAPPRGAEAWLAQARAQGHAPPMSPERIPIPIRRANIRREGEASLLSNPVGCDAY